VKTDVSVQEVVRLFLFCVCSSFEISTQLRQASKYQGYGIMLGGGLVGALIGGPIGMAAGTKLAAGIGLIGGFFVGSTASKKLVSSGLVQPK
jgi:uncharacterized protein YcfJ